MDVDSHAGRASRIVADHAGEREPPNGSTAIAAANYKAVHDDFATFFQRDESYNVEGMQVVMQSLRAKVSSIGRSVSRGRRALHGLDAFCSGLTSRVAIARDRPLSARFALRRPIGVPRAAIGYLISTTPLITASVFRVAISFGPKTTRGFCRG